MNGFYAREQEAAACGRFLAGADEAGRGPLAGPVVAAAVILPADDWIEGVGDSKKLTEKQREALYPLITAKALDWSVGIVDVDVIESENILNAARKAFQIAITGLKTPLEQLIMVTDQITGLDLPIPYTPIIKGDASVYSIAAASIIAKVTRDRIMIEYDSQYPEYGFAGHKGYGSARHREALRKYGPCPIHRMSFLTKILADGKED